MYEDFFQLNGRPFLAAPVVGRYYAGSVIDAARQTLSRAIQRGEGAGLVIGPSGTGKTLLCQLLAAEFDDTFSTALLASGRLDTRSALLQAILFELKLPYRGLDEGELRLSLLDHLQPRPDGNAGLLLIIDEAHCLPWRLLEEVRMLTNFARDGQPRVRVVLSGSATLEERFASPKMASFSQRLAARCYLESLSPGETAAYVRAQVIAVGGEPERIFHEEAYDTIYRATDGIPRLINQVCDHALLLASLGGMPSLSSDGIEEAWADLQQLPGPWSNKSGVPATQIIEFGGLEADSDDDRMQDLLDDAPEAIPFPNGLQTLHLAEPEAQLDRISEQLSQIDVDLHLDDDFAPAGRIVAEVDLDFPEFADAFSEHFEDEEVLLDPYFDAEIFAEVPRVNSWEGEELGSMLESFNVSLPSAGELLMTARVPARAAAAPRLLAASSVEIPATVAPIRKLSGYEQATIEIDEEHAAAGAWQPAPPRRKLQFGQLFVKMRRDH